MAIIEGEDIDAYHHNPALSNSKLSVLRNDGPQAFYRQFLAGTMERPDSDAFRFGRMFDDRIFLPEHAWRERYVVRPPGLDGRTKEGKVWLAEASTSGRTVITADEAEMANEMAQAIDDNDLARTALSGGRSQVTIRRLLPGLNVTVQARPDYLKPALVVDLKTTSDLVAFRTGCVRYGYHRQIALAQWLLAQEGHQTEAVLVVVEKKIAPRCRVLRIPETVLCHGWEQVKADVEEVARRTRDNDWQDRQTEVEDVAIPVWQERELEQAVA